VKGGIVLVVVGGTVVVVDVVLVVVSGAAVVVDSTASSGAQATAKRAKTIRTEMRRFMVDLEMDFRSPSHDRAGTLTV
jgi:hypothetical protein